MNFSQHLPLGSATYRALKPEEYKFSTRLQLNAIIADVFDVLALFSYMYSKRHGGRGRKPKPYPRPWDKNQAQKIGSDPIPISQFNEWYYGGE